MTAAERILGSAGRAPLTLTRQVGGFGIVSGCGLALDCGLFAGLVHGLGCSPGWSNLLSAGTAVTLVFIVSVRRIFADRRSALLLRCLIYGLCQGVLVTAASAAVAWVAGHGWFPIVAKIAVLPLTFSCNFVLMKVLAGR